MPPSKGSLTPTLTTWSGWIWTTIAALVLLAAAGGFALGVIITIECNGKKTSVEVPDGSHVAIDPNAGVNVRLPSDESRTKASSDQMAHTETAHPDFRAIQGVWKVVERKGKSQFNSLLNAQRSLSPNGTYTEDWKTSRIEITRNRMRVFGEHELPAAYEYQINPSESPKMVDCFVPPCELLGVYELDGDQLKLCFDWSGYGGASERPQTVWAGLRSGQEMLVLERLGETTSHPDEEAIRGEWVVASAQLTMRIETADAPPQTFPAAPVGSIEPGRPVIITSEEFIIKGLPGAKTLPPTSDYNPSLYVTQPVPHDMQYGYALDEKRGWIAFDSGLGEVCPGLYQLTGDTIFIRLGSTSRPEKIDAPIVDGEAMLTLRRPAQRQRKMRRQARKLKPLPSPS